METRTRCSDTLFSQRGQVLLNKELYKIKSSKNKKASKYMQSFILSHYNLTYLFPCICFLSICSDLPDVSPVILISLLVFNMLSQHEKDRPGVFDHQFHRCRLCCQSDPLYSPSGSFLPRAHHHHPPGQTILKTTQLCDLVIHLF